MIEELIVADLLNKERVVESIEARLKKQAVFRPIITISRQPGSGGKPIGKYLAKKLDFKLYDKQLIHKVSEQMKLPTKTLEQVDEKGRSGVFDFVNNLFDPDYVSDEVYFRSLCQVVLRLAQKGSSVLMGRGANFIVPQMYALRVRVVAPYRVRVARAVEYEGVDWKKARDIIKEVSAERSRFVKEYMGKRISTTKYYDLTINTTFLSIEDSAKIIMKAYRAKFPEVKNLKFRG